MEGDGDDGKRSASTSSAEAEVRCDKARSSASEGVRRRGSAVAIAEAEGPLIFSARSGESGSPICGGVLAGDDMASISAQPRSMSSSSLSDWLSAKDMSCPCSVMNQIKEVP